MNKGYKKTEIRKQKKKELLIKKFKNSPVVAIACKNVGIARSSYYRYRKESKKFSQECDKAIAEGCSLINDLAVSQLISSIRDKNMTGIIWWLKNNDPNYAPRLKVEAKHKIVNEKLTKEQEKLVDQALKLISPAIKEKNEQKTKK